MTGTVRWAARQSRVDDDPLTGSGLDAGETPGWAVLDIVASWRIGAGFRLLGGVENAIDRTYAEHLNRDDFFDPIRLQINEPGRSFWLRMTWSGGN
jgi:iron complex outermembrane receptor protein